jgi:hypothetical protein
MTKVGDERVLFARHALQCGGDHFMGRTREEIKIAHAIVQRVADESVLG